MIPSVARAKTIDKMIRGKAEVVDISDDDWDEAEIDEDANEDDEDDGNEDDNDDNDEDPADVDMEESKPSKSAASLKAKAAGPSYQREPKEKKPTARRGGVEDLLTAVQSSIDPAARTQRDEMKIGYAFFMARINALEAEIREKDSRLEKLQAELRECERSRNTAERETDNLRSRLQMQEFIQQIRFGTNAGGPSGTNRTRSPDGDHDDAGPSGSK